jgi:hypothetical protein
MYVRLGLFRNVISRGSGAPSLIFSSPQGRFIYKCDLNDITLHDEFLERKRFLAKHVIIPLTLKVIYFKSYQSDHFVCKFEIMRILTSYNTVFCKTQYAVWRHLSLICISNKAENLDIQERLHCFRKQVILWFKMIKKIVA